MIEKFLVEWKYPILVKVRNDTVLELRFLNKSKLCKNSTDLSEFSNKLKKDISLYFMGEPVNFSRYNVEIKSNFVKKVLNEVRTIEFGKVKTYGELAKKLKTSPRAVGRALKANPAPIIIPCHRVVSSTGVGGFNQGIKIKIELLRHEGINMKNLL
ncbi:MAG: cysteine methyltransferase [Archaeoglobus sp.]|jgi:methylated-DNA-[protein]-cysteine S-methyltransferase|nr:MAG: cysteine methyltransferase [Archaeoglobus sp.]